MPDRRWFALSVWAVLLAGVARAVPIPVENFSFELPGTTKQTNFTNVPGWHTDIVAADSGVETGYTPTDGTWTAYMRGGAADPTLWQLTGHKIVAGDVFELKVDARITWQATTMRMTLYYDKDGARVPAATQDVTLTSAMATYTLSFASVKVPASAGYKLGIELANISGDNTWMGLDNVRLELVVKGTTGAALSPKPADGVKEVSVGASLSWTPGPWAATHNIYLGTSFADVNSADADHAPGVQVWASQDVNSFDPGRLELGRTYYWRIDEVNAAPSAAVFKGNVWSFTTEPRSYPITGVKATASSSQGNMGPENTVNGSGLDAGDQHGTEGSTMWISTGKVQPNWIQYEFPGLCKLDQLLVWNCNYAIEPVVGFGAKDVTVELSQDGVTWTMLAGVPQFAQGTGTTTYTANTVVDFHGAVAKFVKLTVNASWGGLPTTGLSEVRFYAIPLAARAPDPASGATGISPQATLSWRPGREAASHRVYLGTDKQAVLDGTAPMTETAQPSFAPAVDLAKTYYWKVVEVNQAQDPTAWESEVWSFTTAASIAIDDFENYTDNQGSAVFDSWVDGWDSPTTNGAVVGHSNAPFAEQTIVHGGRQSMPLAYNNTAGVPNSQATRTFADTQDWTKGGAAVLMLHFYGAADNATNVPLWVQVTDQSKKSAKATFGAVGEDVTALAEPAWTAWSIPLKSFSGVNLARVQSITIGLGPGAGSGTLFVDDIQLSPAPAAAAAPAVLVGYWKLDNNAQDSSGNGNNGTLSGNPIWTAAGKIGGALNLDGVDDYVDCGNGASLNITDAVTLSAWIKPGDVGNGEHNPFVAKGDQSYSLKHNTANTLEFFVYDAGAWYAVNSAVLDSNFNGAWHHVAGTYDGAQLKLYVDGVLVASRLRTGAIASTTFNVNIGRDAQNTTRLYKGQIDEVRIYHGALPRAEILKLANP